MGNPPGCPETGMLETRLLSPFSRCGSCSLPGQPRHSLVRSLWVKKKCNKQCVYAPPEFLDGSRRRTCTGCALDSLRSWHPACSCKSGPRTCSFHLNAPENTAQQVSALMEMCPIPRRTASPRKVAHLAEELNFV